MKGLPLCEAYYNAYGRPMLEEKFSDALGRIAVGLAGPGSECFGFDDELSRDHDWGPSFCLWLTVEDTRDIGQQIAREYATLPRTYLGFGPRVASPGEEGRVGACGTIDFFETYLGIRRVPDAPGLWLHLPEHSLATCTNGQVWADPLGEFSRWRAALGAYYPEDVRLKKLASRCITISQSGQYNYMRSIARGQAYAARACEVQFCSNVISLVFLLNRRYTPYFKWALSALKELPLLGTGIAACLDRLLQLEAPAEKDKAMQTISESLATQLTLEGLSDSKSGFLLDHVASLYERITDPALRKRVEVVR